ncbi:unnamed protein product [Prorocentrum cordatum]|uniref:Uncharacterized protein n=1 Tax=Prorocentrum cordatum TaxID=2364126 RepID=A0ABN9RSX7_9DINO|nr:unnamed protein product [Polarella glacialis]
MAHGFSRVPWVRKPSGESRQWYADLSGSGASRASCPTCGCKKKKKKKKEHNCFCKHCLQPLAFVEPSAPPAAAGAWASLPPFGSFPAHGEGGTGGGKPTDHPKGGKGGKVGKGKDLGGGDSASQRHGPKPQGLQATGPPQGDRGDGPGGQPRMLRLQLGHSGWLQRALGRGLVDQLLQRRHPSAARTCSQLSSAR